MVNYQENWFAFEIDSKRHIMDLTIKRSLKKSVCFQFHQMKDDSYKVFWNFGVHGNDFVSLLLEYAEVNKLDKKTPITEVWNSEEFAKFVKSYPKKIYSQNLNKKDMEIVNYFVNYEWKLPIAYGGGLDGHSYHVKIYGKKIIEFERWCHITEDLKPLIPVTNLVIKIADLNPKNCYEVNSIGEKYLKPVDFEKGD